MSSLYSTNNGVDFEIEVAQRLRNLGWDTTYTPRSGDFGADVVARCGPELLVVQCKDWAGPAGFDAVKEVHAARTYYHANHAIVVSRSGYTRQAYNFAQNFNINLYKLSDLTLGSRIDRSVQGRHYREEKRIKYKQALLEQERVKKQQQRLKDEQFILLAWSIFVIFLYEKGLPPFLGFCLFISIFIMKKLFLYVGRTQSWPKYPKIARLYKKNNKGILRCPGCSSLLSLPLGKEGAVNCPLCKNRFKASTC